MHARHALLAWLALSLPQEPSGDGAALLALPERLKVRTLTGEVAKCGELELVQRLRAVLEALGDAPKDLERWMEDWKRTAENAKPSRSLRPALASKLQRTLEPLGAELARASEPRRSALARAILVLDCEDATANSVLGRERTPDGTWATPEQAAWERGARALAERQRSLAKLDFDFERGVSTNPALLQVAGGGNLVRAQGIELHSRLSCETLERILRQALRAAALSHAIVLGEDDLAALRPHRFVLLDSAAQARPALEEAKASHGLDQESYERVRALDLFNFRDTRGWETARWVPEADTAAVLVWRMLGDWLPEDAQPCLRVGHLNWLCLNGLGTSLPLTVWVEDAEGGGGSQRSSSSGDEAWTRRSLWRCARQSLWGCRSWMVSQVRAGRDVPWARAMLDQDGKIRDEALLKTTLACEMLQHEGRFATVLDATRGEGERIRAFERALGQPLSEWEARWKRWIDPGSARGVLQELREPSVPAAGRRPFQAALRALNQARADALKGQSPEVPVVALDPELSRAAELHARYLTLHPEQKQAWPGMHVELADAAGFTVEGSLSGSRSEISLDGDPLKAVQGWLGTIYHRLALLNPGLFGVGIGQSEDVIALDARSLVFAPAKNHVVLWPVPDAVDVPRAFHPELPNPVPGAVMDTLGYPVSVQLVTAIPRSETKLTLELFVGDPQEERRVECHFLSPQAPLQPAYAPRDAWAAIPTRLLLPDTRYTARARWAEGERVWSFTTAHK